MIRIRVDDANRALQRALSGLTQQQVATVTARAINRTLTKGKNQVLKKAIQAEYAVPPADIRKGLDINKAYKNNLVGKINAAKKPISLTHFKPRFEYDVSTSHMVTVSLTRGRDGTRRREVRRKGAAGRGVTFEIKKGKRERIPYAFMIRGHSSKKNVFARGQYTSSGFVRRRHRVKKTGSDTPIQKMMTTSLAGMSNNKRVKTNSTRDLTADFAKRLKHEIDFLISRPSR